jgi:hydrogenase-4 component E
MSDVLVWAIVGLGFIAIVARRRTVAIAVVATQAMLVAVQAIALAPDRPSEFIPAALILAVRACVIGTVLFVAVRRTPHLRPAPLSARPIARLLAAAALVLVFVVLIPPFGLELRVAEHGSVAIVATGLAMLMMRRQTLFQVLALLIAENGIALAAIGVAGGMPFVIELGVAFDLVLVVTVATVFHDRIFEVFGTTDTHALSELRD